MAGGGGGGVGGATEHPASVTAMAPDANAVNAVFYALSTLAQTCAALAALVGALALYKLQSMREGRAATERNLRELMVPLSSAVESPHSTRC